ncbi:MAG: CcdB family protein [Methylovulum sp.]|nr:CcdB family protein [Methylovulum sp.]
MAVIFRRGLNSYVYANPSPKTKRLIPYLLDIQNDLLASLATTVVIPLCQTTEIVSTQSPS